MEQRDCDRVRESIEDDFVDDVAPRADRVPATAEKKYPDPFSDRGPVRRSHLTARNDESPAVCLSGCAGGGQRCSAVTLPAMEEHLTSGGRLSE